MGILPREQVFFDLYQEQAAKIVEAAELLAAAARSPEPNWGDVSKAIHEIELEVDRLTRDAIERLHKTFITPLDPEDIHDLAVRLDDILDAIDHLARRIDAYRFGVLPERGQKIAGLLAESAKDLELAVGALAAGNDLKAMLAKLQTREDEIDRTHHDALVALVTGGGDPIEFIKAKDLYDLQEKAAGCVLDAAHVLERVLLKNA